MQPITALLLLLRKKTAAAPVHTGEPIGLLLALTKAS